MEDISKRDDRIRETKLTFWALHQVAKRLQSWTKNRGTQTSSAAQLEWDSHVLEYVGYLQSSMKKNQKIAAAVPILGPRFIGPTYLQILSRQPASQIKPDTLYLKPLNIVHPFYYPHLAKCPVCLGSSVNWEGWTGTGAREVHGIMYEELAIGTQLRCKDCEKIAKESKADGGAKISYCHATTNPSFWQRWEHWEIPRKYLSESVSVHSQCRQ